MRTLSILGPLLLPAAVAAQEAAHTGIAGKRTGPEPSDIVLAIVAAAAIWFVRRALRARFAKRQDG